MAIEQTNLFGEKELLLTYDMRKRELKTSLQKYLRDNGIIKFKKLYEMVQEGTINTLPNGIDRQTWINIAYEVWRAAELKGVKKKI